MVRSSTLRRLIVGGSLTAATIASILTPGSIHTASLYGHVLEACSTAVLFTSTSLALAIHRSYPKKHDKPSDFEKLFTRGPYKACRHPFYLLLIIATFSLPLAMLSLWGLAIAALSTPLWILLMRLEERELIAYWGKKYIDYMKNTPMLIPIPRPRRRQPEKQRVENTNSTRKDSPKT